MKHYNLDKNQIDLNYNKNNMSYNKGNFYNDNNQSFSFVQKNKEEKDNNDNKDNKANNSNNKDNKDYKDNNYINTRSKNSDTKIMLYNHQYQRLKNKISNKKNQKNKLGKDSLNKKRRILDTFTYKNSYKKENVSINRNNYTEYNFDNYFSSENKYKYNYNYYKNRNLSCRACNIGINNSSRGFSPLICTPNNI